MSGGVLSGGYCLGIMSGGYNRFRSSHLQGYQHDLVSPHHLISSIYSHTFPFPNTYGSSPNCRHLQLGAKRPGGETSRGTSCYHYKMYDVVASFINVAGL